MIEFDQTRIKYNEKGLVPVVVQSVDTNAVLMLAYMNSDALALTLKTGYAHYYSRSRKALWKKGETSGNIQTVQAMFYDCDADAILIKIIQTGVACHTGEMSCFHNKINDVTKPLDAPILEELYGLVKTRKANPKPKSYTTYLFTEGLDKILKKMGEETAEVIIGAKNNDKENTINELADLVYHTLVMMVNEGITLNDINTVLKERRQ